MKTYLVGGAVRDSLLGLSVQDRDYVVVGATPEDMVTQGFIPVGKDFPVFIHPTTHEQYALARTERKSAPGYAGFVFHTAPDVTLEQDLMRRDLTINAIAQDEHGQFIDPFGGRQDLAHKVFRHVSGAFTEDPVRILRVARFAARFADFSLAPEMLVLMREMVASGEVDALVPERIWQELARGFMEPTPSRMLTVLRECGALARILPELNALWGVPQPAQHHPEIDTGIHMMLVIDYAARLQASLPIRWAALLHDLGKGTTPPEQWPKHHGHEERSVVLADAVCKRLKVPGECRDLAIMTAREHGNLGRIKEMRATTMVALLERCDAFRRPQRFIDMLLAAQCDYCGRYGYADKLFSRAENWQQVLRAAQNIHAGDIAQAYAHQPQKIAPAIHAARVEQVKILAVLEGLQDSQ